LPKVAKLHAFQVTFHGMKLPKVAKLPAFQRVLFIKSWALFIKKYPILGEFDEFAQS
jgi:hypothetical protein